MKLVVWEGEQFPDIIFADGEVLVIEDCLWWSNLGVGDMIQHKDPGFGTSCYFVTAVEEPPEGSYPRGIKLVTISRELYRERV